MSWFSVLFAKKTGAPETDWLKLLNENPLAAALLKPMETRAIQAGVDALDPATFQSLYAAVLTRAYRDKKS
jgi:hypothetical protein